MNNIIRGTEFNYKIDMEHGINRDGFIAEGTESIVFKGVKYGNNLRYSCALKFKPKYRLNDFMHREYRILESLQTCRSVVRVLDVIEDLGDFVLPYGQSTITGESYFCVVEEYIDGESLQDYCIHQWYTYNVKTRKWERNTTEHSYREVVRFQNQIIQFMINLCEIMEFVSNVNERNGKNDDNSPIILHCDIKPENIMVTKYGKELVLIDFGRSQSVQEGHKYQYYSDKANRSFTADYTVDEGWLDGKNNFYSYGTVGYAAPECYAFPKKGTFPFESQSAALTHGLISVESDIFGFGATFSECFKIYEICEALFNKEPNSSDLRFFNRNIEDEAVERVRSGMTVDYCDRDFRGIDLAFHEALEDIIRKCTRTRHEGFQLSGESANEYYHNFYQLKNEIERARDVIPALDRKTDPVVRQSLGVSGFFAAFAACFFVVWTILTLLANPIARDKWDTLKRNYTDNQKRTTFVSVAENMMNIPWKQARRENYEEILLFTYGGKPNDQVIDSEEAEILANLLKEYFTAQSDWITSIDCMIQNGKSDNLDDISKTIHRLNLSEDYHSDGYALSKALTTVNEADDTDSDKLIEVYEVLLEHAEKREYGRIIAKLAIKLMSGRKIDTLASALETDRESVQELLAPLTAMGGE